MTKPNPIIESIKAMHTLVASGSACEYCDADSELIEHGPNMVTLQISHDPDCPELARHIRNRSQRRAAKRNQTTERKTTMTDMTDNLNPRKVQQLLTDAWNGLDPQDRAEREAYDQLHGIAGVTMKPDGDLIEFTRGGRTLALIHRDDLCGDGPLDLSGREFIADDDG
jgi:hypothetical protein